MIVDHVERIRSSMLALCEPLHEIFTDADVLRRERLPELESAEYRWHTTHTVRALAHRELAARVGALGEWRISGNHAQNGALWLSDGQYRVRILHALSSHDVPPPGSNGARRAFYRNIPVDQRSLFDDPSDKLLVLWRFDPVLAVPGFRVVRPIGTWKWGSTAKIDIDFMLPTTAEDLSNLRFEPADEGFELDLPAEGDQESGDGLG